MTINEDEFADVIQWLKEGDSPIFIGFGSMVIKDTSLLSNIIMESARAANARVIVQSNWSKLNVSEEPLCKDIGPAPHDWLLPQCCAVIHHGGAGTTAAGLRYGLPTLVCPFFADQFMWANMVSRAKVGPDPCPVNELTSEILTTKFQELRDPDIKANAAALSVKMNAENGVQGGMTHFFDDLPRDKLLCDVSLILGEIANSKYRLENSQITIGTEVGALLAPPPSPAVSWRDFHKYLESLWRKLIATRGENWMRRNAKVTYALGQVKTVKKGCSVGCAGCWNNIYVAVTKIFTIPDNTARSHGCIGCLCGAILSPFYAMLRMLLGVAVFFDRIALGCINQCEKKNQLYFMDTYIRVQVYSPCPIEEELLHVTRPNMARTARLAEALQIAKAARKVFDTVGSHYPEDHFHWTVAPANLICDNLSEIKQLKGDEPTQIAQLLEAEGTNEISFARLCYYIGDVVKKRKSRVSTAHDISMKDLYGGPEDVKETSDATKSLTQAEGLDLFKAMRRESQRVVGAEMREDFGDAAELLPAAKPAK